MPAQFIRSVFVKKWIFGPLVIVEARGLCKPIGGVRVPYGPQKVLRSFSKSSKYLLYIYNNMELKIVENKCPYCGKTFFMNKRSFANHVRWCKSNPKYEEIRKRTIEKLSGEKVARNPHLMKCELCGKEYIVFCTDKEFERGCYKKTCSDLCAKRITAKKSGEEKNKKISSTLRKKFSSSREDYDENLGLYVRKCQICGKEFRTKKHAQRFCSCKCAAKYRNKNRIENKTEIELYKRQCQFVFALNEFPNEFNFALINENGWYKAKNHGNNLGGITRDHMFSIKEGFRKQIDPYYISHPANCELMRQADNASKHSKCSINEKELMERITEWEKRNGVYTNKIDYYGIEKFRNMVPPRRRES